MRRGPSSHAAAAAMLSLLACAAGCGRVNGVGAASHYPEPAALVTTELLADDDIAPDLIPRITRPPPEPEPSSREARGRVNRIGVRAAYLLAPTTSRGEWDSSFVAGAYVRYEGGAVFEFAVDYATLEGAFEGSQGATSTIVFGRFDVLMSNWRSSNEGARLYLLAGGAIGFEDATWVASGETASRTAGLVDVGVGIGSWNGTWDVRATYAIPGAEYNAEGLISLGAGFAF